MTPPPVWCFRECTFYIKFQTQTHRWYSPIVWVFLQLFLKTNQSGSCRSISWWLMFLVAYLQLFKMTRTWLYGARNTIDDIFVIAIRVKLAKYNKSKLFIHLKLITKLVINPPKEATQLANAYTNKLTMSYDATFTDADQFFPDLLRVWRMEMSNPDLISKDRVCFRS